MQELQTPSQNPWVRTDLDIAREQLSSVDTKIADLLGSHFRAAQNQHINPVTAMVAAVQFPQEIENLAIERNTPKELFAGVSLFLALRINQDDIVASRRLDRRQSKLEKFKELCGLLCDRHDASRVVFQYKSNNRDAFIGDNAKVVTFIPEQHQKVVARMHQISTLKSYDGDLSANIIDWVAAVNAGWQDMAINDNSGPFIIPVAAGINFEIRDPRPALAA